MRTDCPVWEQGFSFLVGNPDNDVLQIKILDQKTGIEIGRYTYILSALLTKNNLEIQSQPFQLQKSGPESKILIALSLKILKKVEPSIDDITDESQPKIEQTLSRTSSTKTTNASIDEITSVEIKVSNNNVYYKIL